MSMQIGYSDMHGLSKSLFDSSRSTHSYFPLGQPSDRSTINKTNRQNIDIPINLNPSAFLCRDSCNDLCIKTCFV